MPDDEPTPPADDDALVVSPHLTIASAELQWRYSATGGPGGQHANTANTRATVTWDVVGSPSLNEAQRALIVARFGAEVSVTVGDERSQLRNRNLARERLAERVAESLKVLPTRRKTRPSKSSQRRRLDAKSRRADVKTNRRRPDGAD